MGTEVEKANGDVWVLTVMSAYSEEPPTATVFATRDRAVEEMERSILAALDDKEMNLDPADLVRADDFHAEITGEIAWRVEKQKIIY